ncbi:glycosyltransferase [Paraburkholderia sp. SIMBA_049]
MVTAFADDGFDEILWVDPYPTRLPNFADLQRLRTPNATVSHRLDPRIHVIRPRALPVEPLPMSGLINRFAMWRSVCEQLKCFARDADYCVLGIGRPSKLADWALRHVAHDLSFVDVLDNFPAFYQGVSRLSMRMRLRSVLKKADDVYCSSSALALDIRRERPDALVVLNGYPTSSLPEPSNAGQRRYIGYVGSIADWFDWPLVQSLAEALPDATVRLIGPEFVTRPANLPANIELLGEVPQERVGALVQEFAIGLIPFRINALTAGVDPIKFYEYRSFGVPIWSTAFGEMSHRNYDQGVMHIASDSNWRSLWDQAPVCAVTTEDIASFRREVDWSRRFDPILARSRVVSSASTAQTRLATRLLPAHPAEPKRNLT